MNKVITMKITNIKKTKKMITYLKFKFLNEKCTSTIPVVLTRVRKMSCSVGI